jgi:hypothetical protein
VRGISHIKYRELSAFMLFNIQEGSSIHAIAQKHRFAALPSQRWEVRRGYDDNIVGRIRMASVRRRHPYNDPERQPRYMPRQFAG